jgi:cbb3-type cytochrome c oxidase subunit III
MIGRTILVAVALVSCGWEEMSSHPCPDAGTTLTYETFGQPFFESWCISCHGGPNGYSSRSFTDLSTIRVQAADIFRNAADDNATMPPGPNGPSKADRDNLGEWLSCGAP